MQTVFGRIFNGFSEAALSNILYKAKQDTRIDFERDPTVHVGDLRKYKI